jgi:hypothetical protein
MMMRPLVRATVLVIFVIGLVVLLSPTPCALAQSSTGITVPNGHGQSIPRDHLYWHFLLYQLYLDRTVAAEQKAGMQRGEINKHYQTKLDFSDSQFAIVRDVATKLDSDLKNLDAEAKPIIDQFRKDYPPGTKLDSPPPVPARLVELQKQREAVISTAADALRSQLGVKPTAKMDDMLNKEFAPRVTFKSLTVPIPKRPRTAVTDVTGVK